MLLAAAGGMEAAAAGTEGPARKTRRQRRRRRRKAFWGAAAGLTQLPFGPGSSTAAPAGNGGEASQKQERVAVPPDADLGMMAGILPISPLVSGLGMVPPPAVLDRPVAKEIIHYKSCTLFPDPHLHPPPPCQRPPGCKTVYVGGLPANMMKEIIKEIFETCGEIVALRKNSDTFCHIRFAEEYMTDKAVQLSGYHVRLGSSTDKDDNGHLVVDFAIAQDDLYEWECKQREEVREERRRRRLAEERHRPPSPPPVVYSDHECFIVAEKLKDEAQFSEAVQTLHTWIERGAVTRRTANNFYSMIQSINSHIRRLLNEKAAHEKEMEEAKDKFKLAVSGILAQSEQIVAVHHSASKQKAWDLFTKGQRKNLRVWRSQAEEIRNIHNDVLMGIREEEEMEISDEDTELEESALIAKAEALKEENDSLRCQLDAYRNEVELLKQEQNQAGRGEASRQGQKLKFLQQALQGMQQHLLELQNECERRDAELDKAKEEKTQLAQLLESLEGKAHDVSAVCSVSPKEESMLGRGLGSNLIRSEREGLLVGIISTFLHVHPYGASIEYICSYLQRLESKICASEVEALLTRLQHTFKQERSGIGASLEKRWKFCGFEGLKKAM
ncbi:ecto-NOX disulfide-thiol exchanger 2 isoform X2 [Hemicordylus capensis]|uniref:ecto-NOX disulfide-thiol exchanger 2 isoform X2 n=1 Tax=Hemicordylus capensis TaxID=884348 RepID=UPI0023046613|nr:ecto-NOX disulfide-thiol exchanger 2 isoform X2 [Hemicordylus capensis]